MKRSKLLLFNSILLTIYLLGSLPYYLIANSGNERFVIFSALYTIFVVIHEIFIGFAVLFQWIGYLKQNRGLINFSTFVMFIGAIAFFFSFIVIIPMMIINLISRGKRKKSQ